MKPLVVTTAGETAWARRLVDELDLELAETTIRSFPDGETYLRVDSPVEGRPVVVVTSLVPPNTRTLPLIFTAETVRDLGASRVGLVAPYLPYMRQDARFRPGEGVTSHYFSRLVSRHFDWLVTVDPHLHRHSSLETVYSIPTRIVRSAESIAQWIETTVERPLLVGPDEESAQWVEPVAECGDFPVMILDKTRCGDYEVDIQTVDATEWSDRRPVIIDDIISTGGTMLEAVEQLSDAETAAPICVGIHGLFAEDALERLQSAPTEDVVTCNTVPHETNVIDVRARIIEGVGAMLAADGPRQE